MTLNAEFAAMHSVVKYRRASVLRGAGRRWAWGLRAWLSTVYFARIVEARLGLLKLAVTVACFLVFLFLLPGLLFLYSAIKCWRAAVGAWAVWAVDSVEEMAGVTVRGAMETPNSPGVHTLLLNLSGTPTLAHIRAKIMEEVVERQDANGRLLHPNLQRRLGKAGGYQVWLRHDNFDISQHVTLAPVHYQGRLLTSRNIQEYVNEVVSQPLPKDLPPWHVTLIMTCDGGSGGDGETWVVARAHHLLASSLSLPDLLVEAYPDPWLQPASRGLSLLTAPAATARLADAVVKGVTQTAGKVRRACELRARRLIDNNVLPIISLMEEAAQVSRKMGPDAFPEGTSAVYLTTVLARRAKARINLVLADAGQRFKQFSARRAAVFCSQWALRLLWRCIVWVALLPLKLVKWCLELVRVARRMAASEEFTLVVEAAVEVYWMVRAFFSLPRLVLEAVSVRGDTPLMGWSGRNHERKLARRGSSCVPQGGVTVAWSDPVPLSTVRGVRGATGATLGEVLLTASAGAVRDYFRVAGLPLPEEVSCTVPVYSQRWAESRAAEVNSPGLVTLALPTGAAEAPTALRLLRESIKKIRNYPERYLASVWLMRNVAYFLPVSLLGAAFRALSSRYPVFMSNMAGPQEPVSLWGHDLLNVFHWRPPCDGAVLSVCVTSYRGEALLGVAADGRVVPSAASLPQAFVTHLNELAVEVGVRLERRSSHTWFRSVTPPPTPTPPSTPTFKNKHKFFPQRNQRRTLTGPAAYGRKFSVYEH